MLTPGTPIPFIAAPTGGHRLYTLDVLAHQSTVTFATTGGPGNLDMKVGFGAAPTATTGDCTSAGADSVERRTVSGRDVAGTWYVLLTATSSFSNVTLTATVSAYGTGTSPVSALTSGQAVTAVSGVVGDWLMYSLQVPAGQTRLNVSLSDGTGDEDLYVGAQLGGARQRPSSTPLHQPSPSTTLPSVLCVAAGRCWWTRRCCGRRGAFPPRCW